MFLLELLFILFSGISVSMIITYIIEKRLGGVIMTMDFTSVPVYMIVAAVGVIGCAAVKYLYDEHKEGKKTSRIDATTTDTKNIVERQSNMLDMQFYAQNDKLDMQFGKLDNIDKFVAESRALKQAASGGGVDVNQTINSVQAMAMQIVNLKDKLIQSEKNENSLKQELLNAKKEAEDIRAENRMLRSELNKQLGSRKIERDEPER